VLPREPDRLSSTTSPTSTGERPRIFGLETEYAVVYLPDDADDESRPAFSDLESVIFGLLLRGRKAALSSGIKGGYFLENGGLVHLEIFLRNQEDTPILEVATPECRSPWDLLLYSRAYDHLLDSVSSNSREALRERGFSGRIAFGKNNLDGHGVGYGCHENYLVHTRCTRGEKTFFLLSLPLVFVCLTPAILILIVALFFFCVASLIAKLIPPLKSVSLWVFERAKERGIVQHLAAIYYFTTNAILFPAVALYSAVISRVAFRKLTTQLTPFLISRQILIGAGSLNFAKGVYEMSQRPRLTRTLQTIIMFGKRKTIFDLKGLLYDPLSLFRPSKRFTITAGDSNLSDIPLLLKVGTTALVIEMIEDGESFVDLLVDHPVATLKEVSEGGPWKQIALRDGTTRSSVELQREYLERAKAYFENRPDGRLRAREILELWERSLDAVAERPQHAQDRLDWLAKKMILDQSIRRHTDWKAFLAWGRVLDAAGLHAASAAVSFDDLLVRTRPWRRWRLRKLARESELILDEFSVHRELYFETRKIDLRFHEIGAGEGYQRILEAEGFIDRLTTDEDVQRAITEPPRDTRARIRGYYIGLSQSSDSIQANWNEIELVSPMRHISLPDPFYHRLPSD
jgi:proteasome accessory factor A